jgi:hypothetical protein
MIKVRITIEYELPTAYPQFRIHTINTEVLDKRSALIEAAQACLDLNIQPDQIAIYQLPTTEGQ